MARALDLLIRNARLPRAAGLTDIAVRDGLIVESGEATSGVRETIDAAGALVTAALVEPHIHLDAVLTVGQPRYNLTGSLFEGIAIWGEWPAPAIKRCAASAGRTARSAGVVSAGEPPTPSSAPTVSRSTGSSTGSTR